MLSDCWTSKHWEPLQYSATAALAPAVHSTLQMHLQFCRETPPSGFMLARSEGMVCVHGAVRCGDDNVGGVLQTLWCEPCRHHGRLWCRLTIVTKYGVREGLGEENGAVPSMRIIIVIQLQRPLLLTAREFWSVIIYPLPCAIDKRLSVGCLLQYDTDERGLRSVAAGLLCRKLNP